MFKNNPILKLNSKPHTLYGISALIVSGAVYILSILAVYYSAFSNLDHYGNLVLIGSLEWGSMMLTLIGFGLALVGESSKETENITSHIALVLLLLAFLFHGIVIYRGF